ncbi:MAG: glycosyltransferase family 4 protein [Acidobacteria bacterium]|nr:glycosyltransferase family 4 protein [Acidobacteriota bacterium]
MSRVLLYSRVNPADGGGVQAVVRRLARSLRGAGHTVIQAWSTPDPGADDWTRCFPLPQVPGTAAPRSARSVAGACKAVVRLAAALGGFRPDVVNYHFVTGEALYFAWLASICRYKLVLSAHGSDVLRPKPWDAPLLPRILAGAAAVTTVSRLTARRVIEDYPVDPARVSIIPNGVDCDFWSNVRGVRLAQRPPTILAVGRLHPVKGHDVLLRAFALLAGAHPHARLVLVGDGGFRHTLEVLTAELGITGRVEFAGQLGPEAVRARMAAARCFVLPSRSEGLPLALLEAMAAGLPVVATRVGGVPEVVDESHARLVPTEDPPRMAAALQAALVDSTASEGLAARGLQRARQFSAADADAAYALAYASAITANSLDPSGLRTPTV